VTGNGVRATVAGDDVLVGKPGWLEAEGVDLSDAGDGSSGYSAVGSRYPASSATATSSASSASGTSSRPTPPRLSSE